jgi:thiol-disulfide isomerase/thioredoxin
MVCFTLAHRALKLALSPGRQVFAALRRSPGVAEWMRRSLGLAVLGGVAAMALGWDTAALARLSQGGSALAQQLPDPLQLPVMPDRATAGSVLAADPSRVQAAPASPHLQLPSEGAMPPLTGAVAWLNSPLLSAAALRGKVVLIDFWTFGCSNCRNALPHVREWHRKYKDDGLVVIGVHSPEFDFEKNIANVKRALVELGVPFPVAVDNDFTLWHAFGNHYWPAHYFVDAKGLIRFHHFGEGEYDKSEQVIRQLLDEARKDKRTS